MSEAVALCDGAYLGGYACMRTWSAQAGGARRLFHRGSRAAALVSGALPRAARTAHQRHLPAPGAPAHQRRHARHRAGVHGEVPALRAPCWRSRRSRSRPGARGVHAEQPVLRGQGLARTPRTPPAGVALVARRGARLIPCLGRVALRRWRCRGGRWFALPRRRDRGAAGGAARRPLRPAARQPYIAPPCRGPPHRHAHPRRLRACGRRSQPATRRQRQRRLVAMSPEGPPEWGRVSRGSRRTGLARRAPP